MKKSIVLAAGGIIAAALAGSGCATAGLRAGGGAHSDSPYLIVDDAMLARQISIESVGHDVVGDIMRAHVTLASKRARSLMLQYRFSWYDANGMELDPSGRPYRDLVIQGRDTVSVTSVAPSPHAREFRIRVRKIKAVKIDNIR